jgi:hypothetical protein
VPPWPVGCYPRGVYGRAKGPGRFVGRCRLFWLSQLVDRRLDHRPATARTWPSARERDREREVRDDMWGHPVSERERERAARARALLGHAGASVGGRGRGAAGRSAGPSRREKRRKSARVCFCFSFSKI